jgi:hypothetical protein
VSVFKRAPGRFWPVCRLARQYTEGRSFALAGTRHLPGGARSGPLDAVVLRPRLPSRGNGSHNLLAEHNHAPSVLATPPGSNSHPQPLGGTQRMAVQGALVRPSGRRNCRVPQQGMAAPPCPLALPRPLPVTACALGLLLILCSFPFSYMSNWLNFDTCDIMGIQAWVTLTKSVPWPQQWV